MLLIALDPATNTGICEGEVGGIPTLRAQRFRVSREDELEDIYGRATFFFADYMRGRSPDVVAIETPIHVSSGLTNADAIVRSNGLYAIFAGIAKAKGIRIIRAPISTWRKYTLGHGNLKGEEAKRRCMQLCKQLGWEPPTVDAAEAGGIWLWACSMVDPRRATRPEPLFARF